ncbi:hypothetical protein F4777DRAFT_552658 [Nemania sp. FL0916]|nr:hypothetical protein F4777DRAFT_552658 [Nemania sp. FL0916]
MDVDDDNSSMLVPQIRLYGWQAAMDTGSSYGQFVPTVDRLLSNWTQTDRSICVEIWRTSPLQRIERVVGAIHHGQTDAPAGDPIWRTIQQYFRPSTAAQYACFVRRGDEDFVADDGNRLQIASIQHGPRACRESTTV